MSVKLFPIYLFLYIFLLDKIFLIPFFRQITISWKKFEIAAYETREDLFEQLKNDPELKKNKSLVLILGSSRSAGINHALLEKRFPNSKVYNFSVPYPGTAYYFYLLERIEALDIKIAGIIIEIDPMLLTEKSLVYPMNYSLSPKFVWNHTNFFFDEQTMNPDSKSTYNQGFTAKQFQDYISKKVFILNSYPISVSAMKDNLKTMQWLENGKIIDKRKYTIWEDSYKMLKELNKSQNGGFRAFAGDVKSKNLEEDAQKVFSEMVNPANVYSKTEIYFLEKILLTIQNKNVLLFIPPVSQELLRLIAKREFSLDESDDSMQYINFKNKLKRDTQIFNLNENSVKVLDFNENFSCNEFEDSIHLSAKCILELSSIISDFFPENSN